MRIEEGEGLRRRSSDELVKIGWKEGAEGGDPILQPDPHSKLCLNRRTKFFFVNCTLQRNQTNLWHSGRCQLFVSFFLSFYLVESRQWKMLWHSGLANSAVCCSNI